MVSDSRSFLGKGNVLSLAVAVIVGAAFATIVSSLIADTDTLENYDRLQDAGVLAYGRFVSGVVSVVILASVISILGRTASRWMRQAEAQPGEGILLLREIRDALCKAK